VEEGDLTDDTVLRHVGSAAHTILELCVLGSSTEDAFKKAKELHLSDVTEDHWYRVESLRHNIGEFLYRIRAFLARHEAEKILPEMKLAVDKDWNPVPFMSKNAFFR